jgi:hypothetical protein
MKLEYELIELQKTLAKEIREESEKTKRETIPDYGTQVGRPNTYEDSNSTGWERGGINE